MLERAGYKSEVSGKEVPPTFLHAAHKDHTKDAGHYDDLDNGFMLTVKEHMLQHLAYRGKAHLIGLSERHNEWAIMILFRQWEFMQSLLES